MDAKERPFKKGMIILWYGSIASIPGGWVLCDGDNGTPDLDAVFVRGAGAIRAPGTTGGSSSHEHDFTTAGHLHALGYGPAIAAGAEYAENVDSAQDTGITESGFNVPVYHALCYIMKL